MQVQPDGNGLGKLVMSFTLARGTEESTDCVTKAAVAIATAATAELSKQGHATKVVFEGLVDPK